MGVDMVVVFGYGMLLEFTEGNSFYVVGVRKKTPFEKQVIRLVSEYLISYERYEGDVIEDDEGEGEDEEPKKTTSIDYCNNNNNNNIVAIPTTTPPPPTITETRANWVIAEDGYSPALGEYSFLYHIDTEKQATALMTTGPGINMGTTVPPITEQIKREGEELYARLSPLFPGLEKPGYCIYACSS